MVVESTLHAQTGSGLAVVILLWSITRATFVGSCKQCKVTCSPQPGNDVEAVLTLDVVQAEQATTSFLPLLVHNSLSNSDSGHSV